MREAPRLVSHRNGALQVHDIILKQQDGNEENQKRRGSMR